MLATIIGGALYGLGIGIAFAAQASTGGTDILDRMIQGLFPTVPIDFVIAQLNVSRIAFVITEKGDEISNFLVSTSPRGETIIDVVGAYTMKKIKCFSVYLKKGKALNFSVKSLK